MLGTTFSHLLTTGADLPSTSLLWASHVSGLLAAKIPELSLRGGAEENFNVVPVRVWKLLLRGNESSCLCLLVLARARATATCVVEEGAQLLTQKQGD